MQGADAASGDPSAIAGKCLSAERIAEAKAVGRVVGAALGAEAEESTDSGSVVPSMPATPGAASVASSGSIGKGARECHNHCLSRNSDSHGGFALARLPWESEFV